MFDETFIKSFPGFLSVRNKQHEIVYLNDNFKNWIHQHTPLDPMGKTNDEIAVTCAPNVASVFEQCHDASICWIKNCSSNESLKRTFTFVDKSGDKDKIQYFDALKYGMMMHDEPYIFTVGYDVTSMHVEMQKVQENHIEELTRMAYYDELTKIPKVCKLKGDMKSIIENNPDTDFMVIKFDIRKFKLINEKAGFATGDTILQAIATTIPALLNEEYAFFARESADKFVIFDKYTSRESAEALRLTIMTALREEIAKYVRVTIDFHFSLHIISAGNTDIANILENLNIAHREARDHYHDYIVEYNDDLKKHIHDESDMESRMVQALADNEFFVFLQPKVQLHGEKVVGAEALVRWQAHGKAMFFPNDFIPLFEKNGFVTLIDMYMLEQSCEIIKRWIADGKTPIPISINFSRLHLNNSNFVFDVNALVEKYDIPRKYIEIELTESTAFDNESILQDVLTKLHGYGFTVSMDDFGAGYSSLGLLKSLPVDVIKIDRSFFVENDDERRSNIVIGSMISMAHQLGIHTVAEGVETQEQVDLLRGLGCKTVQGYFYARPMPHQRFTDSYL